MATSSKSNNVHHTRSISLPSGSHPATLEIEAELNKLISWEASSTSTAEKINNGLAGLEKLYKCIDDILSLPLTQQALSHNNEKWVNELLDQSMRLLDVCSSTRDVMVQIKEQTRDLQSALRRRKGQSSIESSIATYTSFRRKAKKDAKRLIAALNQIDNQIGALSLLDLDHHLLSVIRIVKEVSAISSSIFQTLLSCLCVPFSKRKSNRWSTVSRLIHKEATESEDQSQISTNLDSLECYIEGSENGLESIFRSLIKTRASLLNIISH